MVNKQVLVLFDFCETLIGMQTANLFLTSYIKEEGSIWKKLRLYFTLFLQRHKLLRMKDFKGFLIGQLSGIQKEKIDRYVKTFYERYLLPNENKIVLERLIWHQKEGHKIVIISGGLSPYLRYYAERRNIDDVISTELEIADAYYTGKIKGYDCMGFNKIAKLFDTLDASCYDLNSSYCYTDSITDIPLLALVGNRYVVSKEGDLKWARLMGYNIINI